MKYTKYYSGVLRNLGVPMLNVEQYARLMNIVSLEGRLQELIELKESINIPTERYKYDYRIKKLTHKISQVALELNPEILMKDMINKSK